MIITLYWVTAPMIDGNEEAAEVILRHNRWINNMRIAFDRSDKLKLAVIQEQYTKWCEANGTPERDVSVRSLSFEKFE